MTPKIIESHLKRRKRSPVHSLSFQDFHTKFHFESIKSSFHSEYSVKTLKYKCTAKSYKSIKSESKLKKTNTVQWCNAQPAVTKSQKTVKKCKSSFDDKMLKHESARKKNTKSVSSTANSLFRVQGRIFFMIYTGSP